jgi:hypothetical protein
MVAKNTLSVTVGTRNKPRITKLRIRYGLRLAFGAEGFPALY